MYMCVLGERKLYTYTLNSRFWIENWRKENAIHARRRRCYLQKNSKWHHSAPLPDSIIIRESWQNTKVSSNTTKMLASHQHHKKISKTNSRKGEQQDTFTNAKQKHLCLPFQISTYIQKAQKLTRLQYIIIDAVEILNNFTRAFGECQPR